METKAIVEGALLTGITVILILLGTYLPILGSFLLILAPVPLILLAVRWESKLSIIASLVTAIILGVLINPLMFLISILTVGLIGVSMGAAFEENFSPVTILIIGIIATFISLVLSLGVNIYLLNIDLLAELKEGLKISSDIYRELGVSQEVIIQANQILYQGIEFLKVTFPAFFLSIGAVIASLNYYFSIQILNRLGYNYSLFLSLRKIKFSKLLAIIYILSILISNTVIGKNILVLSSFSILLEGLAVCYYYFLRLKVKRAFALFLMIGLLFLPLLNQLILMLGFLDLWFDFRNLDKN